MTSLGGLPVTVERGGPVWGWGIQQSNGAPGDFPTGSHYVFGIGSSGGTFFPGVRPLILTFDEPVRGFGADMPARAGTVFDHHLLAVLLGQALREHTA